MESQETTWKKLTMLQSSDIISQLRLFYGNFLPLEVRHNLAEWIENTMIKLLFISAEHPDYEAVTNKFQNDLLMQIEHKQKQMTGTDMIPIRIRFEDAYKRFQLMDSKELFMQMASILRQECQLLSDFENGNYANYVSGSRSIDQNIEKLKENFYAFQTGEVASWTRTFFDYQQEYFEINSRNSPLNSMTVNGSPSHSIEVSLHTSSLSYLLDSMKNMQCKISEKLIVITKESENILNVVIEDFIGQWKRNQLICGNNDFNINGADINMINKWCSVVGKILSKLYETIKTLQENLNQLPIVDANDNMNSMLSIQGQFAICLLMKLIKECIVIEVNPPQVIKTNTRFSASVRLLIGDALNNKIMNGVVKASIVSEKQVVNMNTLDQMCGEIANNTTGLEIKGNLLCGQFKNMLLKNVKRVGKKSCEAVTDEKFGIVFTVSMEVYGQKLSEKVLSCPIVVIVHGSQEVNAWATIVWDNAFARTNRDHFSVSDTIQWNHFSEALSYKFASITGRSLTAENLHCLAEKMYDERTPFPVPSDFLITWTAFCKDKLPLREFTFWEWFYACLKLTKDHLKNAWYEGKIIGFIDKKKTEEQLAGSPHGTFLLRFSDSELGALSIAWIKTEDLDENSNHETNIYHIQPINSKGFEVININQRINDVDELIYLFPNIRKEGAFRIDYNPYAPCDYVQFREIMRIDIKSKIVKKLALVDNCN